MKKMMLVLLLFPAFVAAQEVRTRAIDIVLTKGQPDPTV